MNIEMKERVYLDANFFIYWFISKEPDLRKRARLLWAMLLRDKKELCSSALAFGEAWWGIRNEYNQQKSVNLHYSDEPLFDELKKFTNVILPKLNLIQFADVHSGIIEAMNYLKIFGLKPRDAFHLSLMKTNNIYVIATGDQDFQAIKDQAKIEVLF